MGILLYITQIYCIIEIALGFGGRGEAVNASGCGPDIGGFDSHRPPHINT